MMFVFMGFIFLLMVWAVTNTVVRNYDDELLASIPMNYRLFKRHFDEV